MSAGRKKGYKHSQETKDKISKKKKGTKFTEETRKKMSNSAGGRKGKKHSQETRKKMSEARKGRFIGKDNLNWKGENASYSAIHHWIKRKKGKPKKCVKCNSLEDLQWANKDHKYKRVLSDWISLCRLCHKKFDKK
jgi:hypothetical protein